jgi:nucleoside 2-deoxyribosyltransferase
MDGLSKNDIKEEYDYVEKTLKKLGIALTNPFSNETYDLDGFNKKNAKIIVEKNLSELFESDCVIINLTLPNHFYVGCIGEMIYAHINKKFVIAICGESGADKHYYTVHHCDLIVKDLKDALNYLTETKTIRTA